MKKALAILSALALVAGAAFADAGVSVGGWGRIGVNPLVSSGAGALTATTDPSWAGGARVGVNFAGHSDNVGFNLNLDSNGSTPGIGDQAKIWVKTNDMFKFEFGKIQGDVLRGKFGDFGLFGDYSAGGEDDIFARFEPKFGLLVNVTPVEGFYIGAAIDVTSAGTSTENLFKSAQAGVGYTIANVGLVRAQFKGSTTAGDVGDIQVAFNLTGVPNISADIGGTIDLASANGAHKVVAGFGFNADALSLTVRAKALVATTFGLGAALKLDYAVASPLTIGVSAGYNAESGLSTLGEITAEPYVKLGYSNGYVAGGFKLKSAGSTFSWAVPLFAEYWF